MSVQVWQITQGSLLDNTPDLSIRFVETFAKLTEARAFLASDTFLATYIKDQGLTLGQFFIIPEGQMFVIMPGRLDPQLCIGDIEALEAVADEVVALGA